MTLPYRPCWVCMNKEPAQRATGWHELEVGHRTIVYVCDDCHRAAIANRQQRQVAVSPPAIESGAA